MMKENRVATLLELVRKANNFRFMMNAFADEYPHAIASGREELWAKAAISIVELFKDTLLQKRKTS